MTDITAIGQQFIDWIQIHRKSIQLFQDFVHLLPDNENEPVFSVKEYEDAWKVQKEASELNAEALKQYTKLIESVDLFLASEQTEIIKPIIYTHWFAMDSAPKDRTAVLLNYFNKDVCVAYFSEEQGKWVDPVCHDDYYDGTEPDGWLPMNALPNSTEKSDD